MNENNFLQLDQSHRWIGVSIPSYHRHCGVIIEPELFVRMSISVFVCILKSVCDYSDHCVCNRISKYANKPTSIHSYDKLCLKH